MNSLDAVIDTTVRRALRWAYASPQLVIGLTLFVGGVMLIADGGSFYYCLAGLAIAALQSGSSS